MSEGDPGRLAVVTLSLFRSPAVVPLPENSELPRMRKQVQNFRFPMRFSSIFQAVSTDGCGLRWAPLIVVLALLCAHVEAKGQAVEGVPQTDLPRTVLTVGGRTVEVQVAATPEARQAGLMFRTGLPEDEGMLFVHDAARVRCMWMQNTFVPLTAAFLDGDGRILGLADMAPLTTNAHCSPGPARYVLEMNRGWFARHSVGPGLQIDLTGVGAAR
jgi:uncharacterized membrane protein (UPF0127 family)